jgi:exopolysaccharide biosynthesis polyprenyl glycosylphosphotransferase
MVLPERGGPITMFRKVSKGSIFLILSDIAGIAVSFLAAVHFSGGGGGFAALKDPFFICALFIFPVCFNVFDLYYPYKIFKAGYTFIDITFALTAGTAIFGVYSFLAQNTLVPKSIFFSFVAVLFVLTFCTRRIYDFLFQGRFLDKKTLIVGTGALAREIAAVIRRTPNSGIDIMGFVSDKEGQAKVPVVGNLEKLISLVCWHNIQLVVLALEDESKISEIDLTQVLLRRPLNVISAIYLFEQLEEALPFSVLSRHDLLSLMSRVRRLNYLKVKRLIDISGAILLLLVFFPVLFFAMLLLSFRGIKNIFYVQTRIGLNSRPFRIIKLRTMTGGAEKNRKITRLGKWLRKYRIDEFPQLFNVLRGDMSLIGPRPEIPYFVHKCHKVIPCYDVISSLKPGLTGWAQVRYKHTTSDEDYQKKFGYNLYYLKNISLSLDLEILLKTVRIILLGKGA